MGMDCLIYPFCSLYTRIHDTILYKNIYYPLLSSTKIHWSMGNLLHTLHSKISSPTLYSNTLGAWTTIGHGLLNIHIFFYMYLCILFVPFKVHGGSHTIPYNTTLLFGDLVLIPVYYSTWGHDTIQKALPYDILASPILYSNTWRHGLFNLSIL